MIYIYCWYFDIKGTIWCKWTLVYFNFQSLSPNNAINDDNSSNLTLLWLRRWKLRRLRIEIKTSIGRFREKGGYIMKEEMQKKLFCKIVLVIIFVAECTFKREIQWYFNWNCGLTFVWGRGWFQSYFLLTKVVYINRIVH